MKKDKQTNSNNQLTPLETALQQQFKPDVSRLESLIREAYDRTAKMQAANMAAMVGFGLLALSIKPIVGHGKFGDWLKSALEGQISKRNAYRWIEVAKFLAAKIEMAERQTDIIAERICEFVAATGIKGGAAEIFSDAKISSNFVSNVLADLPVSTVLNIMKTANANAIEAEDAETNAQNSLTKSDLRGLKGGTDKNGQIDFYGTLFEETRATIETSRSDARFMGISSAQLIDYGNYLISQGRDIVAIGNTKKD